MKCVVLFGFSTTGKSRILGDFREQYGEVLDTLDSDKVISKPDGGHIYNVFLKWRVGHDTKLALQTIEAREREFLKSISPGAKPLLLAAGPFLPREPEWSSFRNRIRPVSIYLQKDPEEILAGLLDRRDRHLKEHPKLASDPGFGCWDQDVTTEYREGRWVLLDHEQALNNVRKHMAGVVPIYEQLSSQTFTWKERQASDGSDRLNKAIILGLGLPSTP